MPARTTISFATLATCVTVGALGAGVFLASAPAKADQIDYVSYLDDNGVAYRDMSGVIALGKENVCHPLRSGSGIDAVIGDIVDYGYSGVETAYIIIGAIKFMCPDQQPTLQEWRARRGATDGPSTGTAPTAPVGVMTI